MSIATAKIVRLREEFIPQQRHRVDRASGTVFGVRVLGLVSANGRRYTPEALRKAVRLYEGTRVNVDHAERATDSRSAKDRIGKLANVRVDAGGLVGDLELLLSHPMTARVLEAAERMPNAFGLSHNADGKGKKVNGMFVIEEITAVRSVDLVADPATAKGLFESRAMDGKRFAETITQPPSRPSRTMNGKLFAEAITQPPARPSLTRLRESRPRSKQSVTGQALERVFARDPLAFVNLISRKA